MNKSRHPLARRPLAARGPTGWPRVRVVLPVLLVAVACANEVTGPTPTLPAPSPGVLPADPGIVCQEQVTKSVVLSGTRFSPIPVDVPNHPRIDLPTVTLTAAHALDGSAGDGGTVTYDGKQGGPNAGLLSWQSQESMAIRVQPRLVLPSGAEGPAPAGLYDLEIRNPDGNAVEVPAALAIVPRPTAAKVDPPLVCVDQGDREITVTGKDFFRINGADAVVALESVPTPFPVKDFQGCTTVPHPAVVASYCGTAVVTLPRGSVEAGYPGVEVRNPETAPCRSTDDVRLRVVPPPTVASADPPVACVAEGPRDVVLHGTGYLEIKLDGESATTPPRLPAVKIGGAEVVVKGADGCEALPVQGAVVRTCTLLTVTVPQQVVMDPFHPEIEVTNPAPAGCNVTNSKALMLVPPPSITGLVPPAVCVAQADQTVEIRGADFLVIDGRVPGVTVGGKPVTPTASGCEDLDVQGMAVQSCTTLTVTLSKGLLPKGEAAVVVTNPDAHFDKEGCHVTAAQPLLVMDPPTLAAVDPPLICTGDGAVPIVLRGTGFLQYGTALPEVRLGGTVFPVDAVGGCTPHTLGTVSWSECTEVHLTVPQGALAAGNVTVLVTNPPPVDCSAQAEGLLVVPPPVQVLAAEPPGVCSSAGDRNVVIRGQGFLFVDGTGPTLTLNGTAFPYGTPGDCIDLAVPGMTVKSCGSLPVLVPQGALAEGAVTVVVKNPPPADCTGRSDTALFIVPKPTVAASQPSEFCSATGGTITIQGTRFTPVATARLSNADDSADATEMTFHDATSIDATFGPGLEPGTYDLTVTNADGCSATLAAAVKVQPTPLVFFVDPPVLYNGISIQVTIYVSGLTADAALVRMLGPNGEAQILAGRSRPGEPNRIQADVPAGLAPGAWSVEVTSQTGCVGVLAGGLTVTADRVVTLESVEPAFVSPTHPTATTLTAAAPDPAAGQKGFVAVPRVYLNPNPAPAGAVAAPMRAIVFLDGQTLSGVVPADLADGDFALDPGTYDVIVVNPDASVGVLEKGLTITAGEPPVIRAVVPGSLDNNAPQSVRVAGENLDAASVSMTCKDPGTGAKTTLAGQVTGSTGSTGFTATLPSGGLASGTICVVTVVNQDGASFNYSAISMKNPAQNLYPWSPGEAMVEARRALSLAAGRPTDTSRYLYAVGGDGGSYATATATVEAAAVDVFGEMRPWSLLRQSLPAPRSGAGMARIGRFLYLLGGHDGATAVGTVLRAQVLDPLAAPEIADLDLTLKKGMTGLAKGQWIYRVSAVFPAGDPSNPGGESLPGETLTVQLPEVPGLWLKLAWKPIAGASGYRLYRTPAPGAGVGDVELLADVPDGATTTFVDQGGPTQAGLTPLPSGSLGAWHVIGQMGVAREAHAALAVPLGAPEASDAATWRLYAFAGRGAGGGYLASYEYATVHVLADGSQVLTAFTGAAQSLSAARAETGAWLVTNDDWSPIPPGQPWIFVGPGRHAAGAIGVVDAAVLGAGGELGTFETLDSPSGDRSGAGYAAANGYLFLIGGGLSPASGGISGELCSGGGGCLKPGQTYNVRNWNSLGISLGEARYRPGFCQESAFVFMAGGFNGTAATRSVDQTVQ